MAEQKLAGISTRAPKSFNKEKTKARLVQMISELDELQNLLYAESKHSILVVLQGMDASGKDGLIRNVFGKMNPQGVTVSSFKEPTKEELSHDFLWRIHKNVPAKGMIQLFNRSHYEDILVTRVHKWVDDSHAHKRMQAINDFERLLTEHNDTHILKFYLHVSAEEQQARLRERMSDPRKQWKYNENDFKEAKLRDLYLKMYEDCFRHCNKVPWHIVPADQNWYKEFVVAKALLETLKKLSMHYPGLKK
ncbi:PPK2 family polyphosphate kinase [Sediminibacterium soli]|uniref:PPK2 family polyphosphate kinase n=1 Tax=Sediminibacterium soli TaxID=2698829 RepID=UPI00137A06E8|nr:PPK2 family polyphosphate kinase [Sediminibacterium soli]NCI47317.1 polyphosphate kinase [Sediminibacterium soli]